MTDVTCDQYRDWLSADLDGELAADESAELHEHLEGCADCRRHADDLEAMRASLRLHAAEELATIPEPPAISLVGSLRAVSVLRWVLFIIGGTLVVLNVSNLLLDMDGVDRHISRHDGVFGTALGIGMLSVAAKPQRAIGLVTLTSTIAVLMAIVAIADIVNGERTMLAEAVHVLEFAGLVCLWVISGGVARAKRLALRWNVPGSARRSTVPPWPTP